jgi:hypothetical protein
MTPYSGFVTFVTGTIAVAASPQFHPFRRAPQLFDRAQAQDAIESENSPAQLVRG